MDIPVSLIHEEDDLPDLVSALIAYDAQNWGRAKAKPGHVFCSNCGSKL
jgi:hypothetical protein